MIYVLSSVNRIHLNRGSVTRIRVLLGLLSLGLRFLSGYTIVRGSLQQKKVKTISQYVEKKIIVAVSLYIFIVI